MISDNLDLNDLDLEEAFLNYLNPRHENFNKLKFCGVCFIGFDSKEYPTEANTTLENEVKSALYKNIDEWKNDLSEAINKNRISSFDIEIFCVPFPCVQEFRSAFLKELGLD